MGNMQTLEHCELHIDGSFLNPKWPEFERSPSKNVQKNKVQSSILPECKHSCLTFVNGIYQPHLSFTKNLTNRFCILSNDIETIISISDHTILPSPLQILHITTAHQKPLYITPKLRVVIGSNSIVNIINAPCIQSKKLCFHHTIELDIERDSSVTYHHCYTSLPSSCYFLDTQKATLKSNSSLKTTSFTLGSEHIGQQSHIKLLEEGAKVSLTGGWMLEKKQKAHFQSIVEHLAPNTFSEQHFKGALNHQATSHFKGKIIIPSQSTKVEALQKNDNLLLSDDCRAQSKPILEVHCDQVKASHQASFSKLSEEDIFYLNSRAIDDQKAKELLLQGFFKPIFNLFPINSLQRILNQLLNKKKLTNMK